MLELKCFLILVLRRFVEFCTARKQSYILVAHLGAEAQVFLDDCTVITTISQELPSLAPFGLQLGLPSTIAVAGKLLVIIVVSVTVIKVSVNATALTKSCSDRNLSSMPRMRIGRRRYRCS